MMFTNLICENTNDAVTSNILTSMEKCSEEKKKWKNILTIRRNFRSYGKYNSSGLSKH